MNDALLREVDSDLRAERMHRLWRQYRLPLAIAIAAIILFTAGDSMWKSYQSKKAGETMVKLDAAIVALQKGESKQSLQQFEALAKQTTGELNDLVRLWQARAQADANAADAAIKTFTDLADHPQGRDLIWRDLACLHLMSASADVPKPCTDAAASPLQGQRLEWQAAMLAQAGNKDEARRLLNAIANDNEAPRTQRERAARLLRALPAGKAA